MSDKTRERGRLEAFQLVVVLLCSLFVEGLALGQDEPSSVEPIATTYDAADASCPNQNEFIRQITARTTHARVAQPGEKARVLRVSVSLVKDAFAGRLVIEDARTTSSMREVTGTSCEEVVEALALIAALAVDPKASTAPRETLPPPTPAPTQTQTPIPTPTSRIETKPAVPDPQTGRRTRLGFGAQVEGSFVADLVPAGLVFGDFTFRDDHDVVAPSIRASFARSLDVERPASVGRATIRFTQGAIEACPIRGSIGSNRTITFRPCGGFSAGVIDADGTGVNNTRSRSRPWATVSAEGRVVWSPTRSHVFAVELEAGGEIPLFRESFFFEPATSVYRAPIFAGFGRIGIMVGVF